MLFEAVFPISVLCSEISIEIPRTIFPEVVFPSKVLKPGYFKEMPTSKLLPEFCTIDLTEGGYHLGTFAIMGVTKPTHKSRRYPDGKIQEIKFPEKPQP